MDIVSVLQSGVLVLLSIICFINSRHISQIIDMVTIKTEPIEMDAIEFKKWLDEHTKDNR